MDLREEAIRRMIRILEQFNKKFKIAICLPLLIEESKFKEIFKREDNNVKEFKRLYNLCTSFDAQDQEKNKEGSKQVVALQNESKWAVVLENLKKFEEEILSIIDGIADKIPPPHANVITHMELLKQIVELQMRTTPKQCRERKSQLRNAEALTKRTQEEIEALESNFNDETHRYEEVVSRSRDEVDNLNTVIEEIRGKRQAELDREVSRFESAMRGLRADFAEEAESLGKRLEAHEGLLDKLSQVHLEQERSLRRHCVSVENKCLASRNAYDRDLLKLNELKETLELQLCVTSNHYELLKNEYDVQSVLYLNLKKERELAMMQAFAERLDNFEKNRAARIIQRTWRAYHERVSSKKKKRTRKNK